MLNPKLPSICDVDVENESRDHERTVREALQLVKYWRDTYREVNLRLNSTYMKISLSRVANELQVCKKKTLDYYFNQIRFAERLGMVIHEHLLMKMGEMRKYNTQTLSPDKKQVRLAKTKEIAY